MEMMTATQAKAAVDAGTAVIVDVREDAEVAQASVPGAMHIPMGELLDRLAELPTDRQVIVICHSGGRSENVCRYLEANEDAFANIANLEGGIIAWSQAGLPTA